MRLLSSVLLLLIWWSALQARGVPSSSPTDPDEDTRLLSEPDTQGAVDQLRCNLATHTTSWVSNTTGCQCECEVEELGGQQATVRRELICFRNCPPPKPHEICEPDDNLNTNLNNETVNKVCSCLQCKPVKALIDEDSPQSHSAHQESASASSCQESLTGRWHHSSEVWRDTQHQCRLCQCDNSGVEICSEPDCRKPICSLSHRVIPHGDCCQYSCEPVQPLSDDERRPLQHRSCYRNDAKASPSNQKLWWLEGEFYEESFDYDLARSLQHRDDLAKLSNSCVDQHCTCINGDWHCVYFCQQPAAVLLAHRICSNVSLHRLDNLCCYRCFTGDNTNSSTFFTKSSSSASSSSSMPSESPTNVIQNPVNEGAAVDGFRRFGAEDFRLSLDSPSREPAMLTAALLCLAVVAAALLFGAALLLATVSLAHYRRSPRATGNHRLDKPLLTVNSAINYRPSRPPDNYFFLLTGTPSSPRLRGLRLDGCSAAAAAAAAMRRVTNSDPALSAENLLDPTSETLSKLSLVSCTSLPSCGRLECDRLIQ